MKAISTQFGTSYEADFAEKTWTFLMNPEYKVRAGEFAIVDKPVYEELIQALARLIDRIEENKLQDSFPSAYQKALQAIDKAISPITD